MTPEQAQALLDKVKGTDESTLQPLMDWKEVAEALATIAGLRYEYDYEVAFGVHWTPQGYEFATAEDTRRVVARRRRAAPARIVRRLVGESEGVE